jgi:hypothetical protein
VGKALVNWEEEKELEKVQILGGSEGDNAGGDGETQEGWG